MNKYTITEENYGMIQEMKEMQKVLDDNIAKEHKYIYDSERANLALLDEFGETNHENKGNWCWWKFTQKQVDRIKLLEELADAWHFALSIDNHENETTNYDELKSFVDVYKEVSLSELFSIALIMHRQIIPIMISITNKLMYTVDEVYDAYIEKNKVNFERLQNGY